MEKSNTRAQELHILWISQSEHIISFHEVVSENYEPLVFSDQNEKMMFVFEKCSHGFRIQ
ncbi:hypothetical protein B5F98_06365 [Pseudoflavonifractor sp. An44]|nr:hypothetical protein B5F98_06365 [Pseudoflavonifractor sp. An44]